MKNYGIQLIIANLYFYRKRTILLFLLLGVWSITVYAAFSINYSLESGLSNTVDRVGADLIVAPEEYYTQLEDSLFMGKPSTIPFDKSWIQKVKNVTGVSQVTSQLFLSTLEADCCENQVQLIAYDPKTDFILQPWIKEQMDKTIGKDEVILGYDLKGKVGQTVTYFGKKFHVVATLENSGMGYDQSIFMNYETAQELLENQAIRGLLSFSNNHEISMVLVRVSEDYTIEEVAITLKQMLNGKGVSVYTSSQLVGNMTKEIAKYEIMIRLGMVLIGIVIILATVAIFSITFLERRRELAIYLSLGLNLYQITVLVLKEVFIISIAGSSIGVIASILLTVLYRNELHNLIQIPFAILSNMTIIKISLITTVLVCITGAITSIVTTVCMLHNKEISELLSQE